MLVRKTLMVLFSIQAWACVAAWQGHQARMHRAHDVSISCGMRRTVHRLTLAISALAQIARLAAGDTGMSLFSDLGMSRSTSHQFSVCQPPPPSELKDTPIQNGNPT